MKKYTMKEFNEKYPNDDACLARIFKGRYPNGVFCPKCQKITKYYKRTGLKVYACEFCGHSISPTAGTIFHKSDTSLRSWFYAMFLMSSTKTGISAKQLERELGVTYKTAWRMFTQIRKLMSEVGWEKWTPKSGKIDRWRCQLERDSARKVHQEIPGGSGETGNGREDILAGSSLPR